MLLFSSKKLFLLLIILFLFYLKKINSKWAFLSDQTKCNLNCLNGGVCSFFVKKPQIHKCICLIGMFEGLQCELIIDQQSLTTTMDTVLLKNEELEEEENEEEEIYEDETKEINEQKHLKNNNSPPAVFGQTQHFIGEETNTMSTNLEKFAESWPSRSFSSSINEEENLEKQKIILKNKKKKKEKKTTTTTPFPYEELIEARDGWMVTRRGINYSSSFAFKIRRKNYFIFYFLGNFIFF